MRLSEITKDEFVQKLKDPVQFKIKNSVKELRDILDKGKKFKMSQIENISNNGRDIIKFTVFFPQSHVVDYPDEVRELEQTVFDPFRDIIDSKMSDAVYLGVGGQPKVTFIYYLKR